MESLALALPGLGWIVGIAIAFFAFRALFNSGRGGGSGTSLNELLDIQASLLDARDQLSRLRAKESQKVRMLSSDRQKLEADVSWWEARVTILTNQITLKEHRLHKLDGELPPSEVDAEPRVILREWLKRKVI
jgi:hypothetical protein